MKWTEAQESAIKARDMSVLVSAAAGSGKTAVLVERVVSLLCDDKNPVQIEELVLATFSNAAAKEMSARISKRLHELYDKTKQTHIRMQIQKLSAANISTVHSLCYSIIKENFYKLDLSPNVKIGEASTLEIMKNESVLNVLEEAYERGEESFLYLSDLMGNNELASTITQMYGFLRSYPFYLKWLDEIKEEYSVAKSPKFTSWGKVILNECSAMLKHMKFMLNYALDIAEEDEKVYTAYSEAIKADITTINLLINATQNSEWEKCAEILNNLSFEKMGVVRKCDNIHIKDQVKLIRDECKKKLSKIAEKRYFISQESFEHEMKFTTGMINTLFELVRETDKLYTAQKREKDVVDFADLEHMALELLVYFDEDGYKPTQTAVDLSANISEVLVDEYQDTNQVQDMIFRAISDEGKKLFMVGDVKQSIYGFRQAKPDIFLEKKEEYPDYRKKDKTGKIIMGHNFRSRKEVTDAINYVFTQIMSKSAGGLDYDESEALFPAAEYLPSKDCGCELVILEDDKGSELKSKEREALYIANRIDEMVRSKHMISDKEGMRPIEHSDIAILLRSVSGKAQIYQNALKLKGIDSSLNLDNGFLSTYEITSVMSMLKVLQNPLLDLELATALMSPLFGLSAQTMARISIKKQSTPLFMRLRAAENEKEVHNFFRVYDELSAVAAIMPVSELIYLLYDLTDGEAVFKTMKNGAERVNNLRLLCDYAASLDLSGYKGLASFINYLNKIEEHGSDLSNGSTSSADTVKIMSIHKSKGLEFPVVFLADTEKNYNMQDNIKNYLIHPTLGFGCVRKDIDQGVQYSTMALEAIRLKARREQTDEELRILYVAMTRAREKLIVTAVANVHNKLKKLCLPLEKNNKIAASQIMSLSSYADIIISPLLHHVDGNELRNIAAFTSGETLGSAGEFKISIISEEATDEKAVKENEFTLKEMRQIPQSVLDRQNFVYPYQSMCAVPTGLAVSEVGKQKEELTSLFEKVPQFVEKRENTGALRGNAIHKFMQYADYERAKEDLDAEMIRLLEYGFLSESEYGAIDKLRLNRFFESALYKRIQGADGILREYSFFANVSHAILKDYTDIIPENATVALQGIADCILFEGRRAVVIDYKTDRDASALRERYATQLSLYKHILSEFLDCEEIEAIIYSFAKDEVIVI